MKKKKLSRLQRIRAAVKRQQSKAQKKAHTRNLVLEIKELEPMIAESLERVPAEIYQQSLQDFLAIATHAARKKVNDSLRTHGQELAAIAARQVRAKFVALTEQIGTTEDGMMTPDIFPDGTRFFQRFGGSSFYVIEQKPQVRQLFFSGGIVNHKQNESEEDRKIVGRRFRLAFPYVVFIVRFRERYFHQMWCYYRSQPLMSRSDVLHYTNMPNCNTHDSSVCLGSGPPGGGSYINYADPPAQQIHSVISQFWSAKANNDWSHHFYEMATKDARIKDVTAWEQSTNEDPLFPLKVEWRRYGEVQSLINKFAAVDFDGGALVSLPQVLTKEMDAVLANLDVKLLKAFSAGSEAEVGLRVSAEQFKKVLQEATVQVSKNTILAYKRLMEKAVREAETERNRLLKMLTNKKVMSAVHGVDGIW